MKAIFLGGFTPNSDKDFINTQSIGAIQYAADSLQNGLLDGLSSLLENNLVIINLPFIGSYPKRFKSILYPYSEQAINKTKIYTTGFLNLLIIKHIFRTFAAFKALIKYSKKSNWVIIYSTHPPFIIASLLYKVLHRNTRACIIIPDLPDHMGEKSGIFGLLNNIFIKSFYKSIKFFDAYILLTTEMINRINVDREKCLVIEGVSRYTKSSSSNNSEPTSTRSILYTGTLAERYGIKNLVNAFLLLNKKKINLLICGEGDSRAYIEEKAKICSNIKFYGQIDRLESIRLQQEATVLVNPRLPGEEYTKYSFPSKVMEYMSSGRPVIMYRLAGIPEEYFNHCFVPSGYTANDLAACLEGALSMSDDKLDRIGKRAQNFVLENKDPITQAKKIVMLLESLH